MSIDDIVVADISLSNASSPTVQGLNTGMIAAYHAHYPDRLRVYSVSTMLAQMVADGFAVTEPAYQAATEYCEAPNAPALCCIGRRANPPLQTLELTCVDGTVGDAYAFTVVGSDGMSHAAEYTNRASLGTAVSGTVAVVNGSPDITFSANQTLPKGTALVFTSQPGVYYSLSAAIAGVMAAVLTTPYAGESAPTTSSSQIAPASVTFDTVPASGIVVASATPVGQVKVGDSVMFASQLNVFYTVAEVVASPPKIILTQPYTGTGAAADYASDVCTASTAATALTSQLSALSAVGTITSSGAVITFARTDGNLTDIQGWLANGFASVELRDITADPGITADLTAIRAANNGAWYGLILDSNSQAEIEAAAAFAEATGVGGKFFFWNNSDAQNTDEDVTTDVFSMLQTESYVRDFGQQNNQKLLNYAGAAICSQLLAMNPGSYTAAFKTQPGVPADSDTTLTEGEALVLQTMTASDPGPGGKNGNYYKTVAGQNWLLQGTCPSGRFMDLTIGIDWLQTNMQAGVAGVIAGLPKVPFTDFGLGLIGDEIRYWLNLGSTPAYGFILPNGEDPARPISVVVPKAASLTSAQRAARIVTGYSFSAGLQGAIQGAVIQGTLIP